jgi:hypothetical protein
VTRQAVLRKLARTIKPPVTQSVSTWRNCVVDHTVTSGSADGITAVFLKRGGDVFPSDYLASYDAAGASAGDMVRVEFADGSPLIHGQVVGLPNLS